MKKFVLLLVIAAFATSPAAGASKKSKENAEAEEIAKQHDNSKRIVRDALPLLLPTWSLPFYFGMNLDKTKDEKKAKR